MKKRVTCAIRWTEHEYEYAEIRRSQGYLSYYQPVFTEHDITIATKFSQVFILVLKECSSDGNVSRHNKVNFPSSISSPSNH